MVTKITEEDHTKAQEMIVQAVKEVDHVDQDRIMDTEEELGTEPKNYSKSKSGKGSKGYGYSGKSG